MLLLASTSDRIRVTSSVAADIHVHASWVDLNGSTVTPGRANTLITTATTADVVGGPGASTVRNVKTLTIRNTDPTDSTIATVIHTDGTNAMQIYQAFLAPGAQIHYIEGSGFFAETTLVNASDIWAGEVIACCRDGNPNYVLNQMQLAGNIAPTPTNIGATVARCELFRPAANIAANTLRWYGVGAVSAIYTAAVYRWSDLARLTSSITLTTTANAWNSVSLGATLNLVAGELYFIAVSANTTGTVAGIGSLGGTVAAATGQIQSAPGGLPGNLSPANLTSLRFQFPVTAGAMPATAGTPAAQAAWTGGMPAFFLDNAA